MVRGLPSPLGQDIIFLYFIVNSNNCLLLKFMLQSLTFYNDIFFFNFNCNSIVIN
ncbi:hypothetical protein [Magpiepox virus 2]|nr:hypothetical protein [Magpiepox virus 2]